MSAQHFLRVKTGTIEILCGTGLEVCCAQGECQLEADMERGD